MTRKTFFIKTLNPEEGKQGWKAEGAAWPPTAPQLTYTTSEEGLHVRTGNGFSR